MMENSNLFFRFGVATFVGILVGLQRQSVAAGEPEKELAAGVRTFALIGVVGCSAALVSDMLSSPWPFVGIALVLGALLATTHYIRASQGEIGLTTETSALVTFIAGALAYWGYVTLAVAVSVATTFLLSSKLELHRFAQRITREDIYATLKFAVITAIVLPVLPNRGFGAVPFDVINPFKIWLLVVFISGISFVGFILMKLVGATKGIGLTGLLGGLASSTAVTLSFTQRSRTNQELAKPFALAITIAWTVMFSRVIVEVTVVNSNLLRLIWMPLFASVVVGVLSCVYLLRVHRTDGEKHHVAFSNPFELGPAIKFGLLFTVILLISKTAQMYLGDAGVYISAFVSGLADVDAIALSVAELSKQPDGISATIAARAIVIAAVANTLAKGLIVVVSGAAELRRVILPGFLLMMATAIVVVLLQ